jgi:hypothetical protein
MAQAVSWWSFTAEAQVQSQASPYGICGAQSGGGRGFSLCTLIFLSRYYSTTAQYLHPFIFQQQCLILASDSVVKMKHFSLYVAVSSSPQPRITAYQSVISLSVERVKVHHCFHVVQAVLFQRRELV